MISKEGLRQLIEHSGISLDSATANQLQTYLALLEKWNTRVNLTSSTEWSRLEPLFQEGISASQLYHIGPAAHLDIGSGAGFPAMLLRILRPKIQLDLVESRIKKCAFLETLVDSLKMDAAEVHRMRLRTYLQSCGKVWDCVTWKAIKLNSRDLAELLVHSHQLTQFWMFHGKQLAVEEPEMMERDFNLVRSEILDSHRSWKLSIYLPRHAFHVKQSPTIIRA